MTACPTQVRKARQSGHPPTKNTISLGLAHDNSELSAVMPKVVAVSGAGHTH
jgi:hypothetical protein